MKWKLNKALIRPMLTYGCETWTLRERDESVLRIVMKMGLGGKDTTWNAITRCYENNTKVSGFTWVGHVMNTRGLPS